jgi:biotin carboxyl carrier protein
MAVEKVIKISPTINIIFFEVDKKIYKANLKQDPNNKDQFYVYLFNTNKSFTVNVAQNQKILPAQLASKAQKASSNFEKELKSPLCGRIIKINVKPNQFVTKNQTLMVIESMKMENEIRANYDAFIKTIPISPQDLVQPNQILMTFENKGEYNATTKKSNEQKEIQNR